MAILNNQKDVKAWLAQAHPQRADAAQAKLFLQAAAQTASAALRNTPIPGASSAPKPASSATSHPGRPAHSTFTSAPPQPVPAAPAENPGVLGPSTAPPPRPAGYASPGPAPPTTQNRQPRLQHAAKPTRSPPLFASTQFSDFSDPESDMDLIDTHLLGVAKPEPPETRTFAASTSTATKPKPPAANPKRPSELAAPATKKPRHVPQAAGYMQSALPGAHAAGPRAPPVSAQEPREASSAAYPGVSAPRQSHTGPTHPAHESTESGPGPNVAVLQEYIRMCEAKIHLLSKCNAVNDSTSLSLDAKKLWHGKQFQPRLRQLDASLSRIRPQLAFLDPLPRPEDLSNVSGLSSSASVQEPSQNSIDEPRGHKSPYFVQNWPTPNLQATNLQATNFQATNFQTTPNSHISEHLDDFQVPDSLPNPNPQTPAPECSSQASIHTSISTLHTPALLHSAPTAINEPSLHAASNSDYSVNIREARQIILDRKNRPQLPQQQVRVAEKDESEDDFGEGFLAGLESSQVENEDTDLSGFIAPDDGAESESIDGSYITQPTQFGGADTDEDDVESRSASEAELDQIRLSQDVAQRLGVTYEPRVPIVVDDSDDNKDDDTKDDENGTDSNDFTTQLNEGRDEVVEIPSDDDLDDDDLDGLKELSFIKQEQPDKLHVISDSDFSDNDDELIQLSKSVGGPKATANEPFLDEVYRILRGTFRLTEFRSNQLEAIIATLKGKDVFVLIPTGGGKSLCFQLPALVKGGHTRGTTVVVSPLISLMQDQVQHLVAKNIRAGMISSKGSADERNATFKALTSGQLDLVYLSPEMINNSGRVQKVIAKLHENSMLARVVVDEAHCVSSWGHDFRPDYKGMSFFKQQFPDVPIMALTATANEKVRLDIVHNLRMHEPVLLKQSFNRVNLMYEVKNKPPNIYEWLRVYIGEQQRGKTGIIYCHSKQSCETTAQKLNDYGVRCMYYHAGMDPAERFDVQEQWQHNSIQVICATIAFGMGIDKPDVRYVIHMYIPRSLEGYYQETGRAGRDGKPSECIMFYSYKDARALQSLIQRDDKLEDSAREAHLTKLQQVVQYCENKTDCRRRQVLHFFNETFDAANCRKMCDNCCSSVVAVARDVTDHCVAITKLVQSLQADKVTIIHCQDVYKGARHGKIIKQGHHNNPFHGLGKDLDRGDIERIFYHLQSEGGLLEYQVMRGGFASTYVKLGPRANVIMKGTQKITLSFAEKDPRKEKSKGVRLNAAKASDSPNPSDSSRVPDLSGLRYTESFVSARDLNSFSRVSLPEQTYNGLVNDSNSSMVSHAFDELRNLRAQKSQELGFGRAHYFIGEALLKEMAVKLPTNAVDFAKLDAVTKEKVPFFQHFKKLLGTLSRARKKALDPASGAQRPQKSQPQKSQLPRSQKVQKRRPPKKPSQFRAMPI